MKSKSNFKLFHPEYGIWYATSVYGIAKATGVTPANFYQRFDITKPFEYRGWKIEPTEDDIREIPLKFINADKHFIEKYFWDFRMQLEKNILD